MVELAESRDLLTSYVVLGILDLHLVIDEQGTIEIMRKMLDRSLALQPPTVQMPALILAPMVYVSVRRREPEFYSDAHLQKHELIFDFFKQLMWSYNEKSRCRYKGDRREYIFSPLGGVISLDYFLHRRVDLDSVKRYVQLAMKEGDVELLASHILNLVAEAVAHRVSRPYLETLALFVDSDDAAVRDSVIAALSRLRAYFPIEVDEFLEETSVPIELKRRVRTQAVAESLGDLLSYYGIEFIAWAIMFDPKSPIMPLFTWWFEEATRVRSFSQWIGLLVKATINIIYGECIFDTGQPELGARSSE